MTMWIVWLGTIAACLGASEARFSCPQEFPCSCMHVDTNEFRFECPPSESGGSFELAMTPGEQAIVQCNGQPSWEQFLAGAVLELGSSLSRLAFLSCPPLDARSKPIVSRALGVQAVHDLKYEDLRTGLAPENVRLFPELKFLELSENPLGRVDKELIWGLEHLTYLGLRGTGVKLPLGFFNGSRSLRVIELSYNSLSRLEPGVFEGLESLEQLNIWKNEISELEPRVFEGLRNLAALDLNNNRLTGLPTDLFADLVSLQVVNLGWNQLTQLPRGLFRRNHRLQAVKIYDNQANLTSLPDGFLADLPLLTSVVLRSVGLRSLPQDVIWNSDGIEDIDVSLNYLEELPGQLLKDAQVLRKFAAAYNGIAQLPDSLFARHKQLEQLDLSYNRIESINENTFEGLVNLKELYMQDNGLSHIHLDAFQDLEELQIANFANNKLTMYTDFVDMYGRVSPLRSSIMLQELYLSNNNISEMYSDWVVNDAQLRKLDLSNNFIKELMAEDLQFVSDTLEVDLRNNAIELIDLNRLEAVAKEQAEFTSSNRDVRVLLSGNPLNCGCNVHSLLRYSNGALSSQALSYVNLDLEEAECASPGYARGHSLADLNDQEFRCRLAVRRPRPSDPCNSGCDCWYRPADKALLVDCAHLALSRAPERIDTHGAFALELDLSNNNIDQQPDMLGWGYEKVYKLDLSANNISSVDESLLSPQLRVLKLNDNNLTSLSDGFLRKLSSNESKVSGLSLQGNPWRCDCDARELLVFVKSRVMDMPELRNASCANSSLALLELGYSDLCPFPYKPIVTISIGLGLGLALIGLVVGLFYRFERHLKIWLYSKRLCMCLVSEEEVDRDKSYDAFLSFSHKDEEFVMRELVSRLEARPLSYRLCIHTRDWLAGEWIPAQINRSVEASRRTIVVLSRNFIESDWSRFEFQAAHKQALREKRPRVIVVLLGDIGPHENLDPELRAYLQTNTYVTWGEPWFWRKLSYALPHRVGSFVSAFEDDNVVLKGVKIIRDSAEMKY